MDQLPVDAQDLDAGLTGASISLDHWDEHLHNRFRNNEQSYSRVRLAVNSCHEAGILVTLSVCATREFTTPENLRQYYDLAKAWGAAFIKILEPRQTGRFQDKEVTLGQEQIELLMNFYLQSYTHKQYNHHPLVLYPGFDHRRAGCLGAGNRYLYIDSKGEIHACPFCHGSVGNALHMSLDEATQRLKEKGCTAYGPYTAG